MNPSHPYGLVIGLDRSDRKADLSLIDTRTGQRRSQTIATSPEALWEWLLPSPRPYGALLLDAFQRSSRSWMCLPAQELRRKEASFAPLSGESGKLKSALRGLTPASRQA